MVKVYKNNIICTLNLELIFNNSYFLDGYVKNEDKFYILRSMHYN